jgi:hypothetical protein
MIPMIIPLLGRLGGAVVAALRAVPWQAYALAAAVAACWWYGEARADQREAEVRAEYELRAMREAEQAQQLFAELEADHRKREAALSAEIIQADARHAQHLQDVEARSAATVAGLKSGAVQLRQHWQACLGKLPGPGQTAGTAGDPVPGADLRAADIGRVQRIAGSCDAEVIRWQQDWQAAVKAINGGEQ